MTDTADPDQQTAAASPSALRRLGVAAVVVSFVGIWGYVMYLTIFEGRTEPRDRLEDTEWAETADVACARSTPEFESIPLAIEADTPAERAELLDTGTDELEEMVGRLDDLAPPDTAEEAAAVDRWLADYRTYLVDRREYAAAQRDPDDPRYDEPFSVTDRGGNQIDVLIDDFAHVNRMENCETPGDV
ncbi:MAG: hypothetical protein U5K30_04125 [Acidimicrobiales bacterium]|nr:hypothetical protein [Acidimicrobiales bacterium]